MIDMRKILLINFFLLTALMAWSQPPGPPPDGEGPPDPKLPERMSAFIQTKLEMTASEREKFDPAFKLYLKDLSRIHRENKGDRLIMQQQMIELRLKYRKDFRQWLGDQRGDRIFLEEERFRGEVLRMLRERRKGRMGPPPQPPGGRRRFK
jgi:hypothetical protein